MSPYEADRERFEESNDRFQAAMLDAIKAHQEGFRLFRETLDRVEAREAHLDESIHELQRLVLEQGVTLREQGAEIRTLRERLS